MRRLTSKQNSNSQRGKKSQSLVTSSPTKEFQTFHVNGTMPTARREREMRDFRTAARAVMSNARCLTEGVDVPAVDMVAFLSPRRSRVDIVQATGRAMRRSPWKDHGLCARAALCRTGRQRNRRSRRQPCGLRRSLGCSAVASGTGR